MRRRTAVVAGVVAMATVLTGCDFSVYSLPLPGGAKIKGPSYSITVEFSDVLDLVPKSSVKVDDVTVGTVQKVWLEGYVAKVKLKLPKSVDLPDNSRATIRQTSLLGEKFVSLAPPTGDEKPRGKLENGELIPLSRTTSNVEVEEVLSALSLLLNGGGVAQLQIITQELNKALTGNEPAIRSVLTQLNTFVGTLDKNKQQIVTAITAVDALAKKLNAQKATLATAIDSLPKSIATLDKQRAALVKTLQALAKLGNTATRVITASQQDLVANLQSLYPLLTKLAEAGENLPKSLELLLTYPFPDAAAKAVKGDFTNLDITLDVNTKKALEGILGLKLPNVGPNALPTGNVSLPLHNPPKFPTNGLPSLPVPTGATTTCITLLGLPVCTAKLNRSAFDPELAKVLMPGVAK
ncbi:phospholipid/cholesterol/gamma-HCH transport system substrate-binding protein [Kribbella orskensis]|uniref:Phospholipid/cholesterol/gamma-HCH transport system substrate-binding protein n=1 Tax=Kribbella orskensis TaxID=2512216 RepID=A0ABY2BHI4_9ACTN|nr:MULTISPECIES: MCE family protein [Kribbella]TCN38640.1 phospholipid/cholesterol/gamma-HCH transport system substrate-binding protein [Kribbella sp. VKM Ac-2500]TCO20821.1 phospholipid/cholesterol/gamma-HCH transport system substrate-binding protein [Kribbella orskensis]